MRVVRLVLSFALILSSSPQLSSQQSSTSQTRDPQAISVASSSVATMGAPGTVSSGGVVATGTITIPGLGSGPLPIVLKSISPRTLRSEIQMPKGLNTLIVNDGHAAIKRPNGSVKSLQIYSTMALRAEFLPSYSLLSEYGNAQLSIRKLADADALTSSVAHLFGFKYHLLYAGVCSPYSADIKYMEQVIPTIK